MLSPGVGCVGLQVLRLAAGGWRLAPGRWPLGVGCPACSRRDTLRSGRAEVTANCASGHVPSLKGDPAVWPRCVVNARAERISSPGPPGMRSALTTSCIPRYFRIPNSEFEPNSELRIPNSEFWRLVRPTARSTVGERRVRLASGGRSCGAFGPRWSWCRRCSPRPRGGAHAR